LVTAKGKSHQSAFEPKNLTLKSNNASIANLFWLGSTNTLSFAMRPVKVVLNYHAVSGATLPAATAK
jgi:hypothetical protein